MTPEQQSRFERQAILEAHATYLLRLVTNGVEDEYRAQVDRVAKAIDAILGLPRPALPTSQKAA